MLVLFLVSVAPTRTLAQGASLAEVLYTDGQRLVGAGEVHEACLKFGESQKIDPRLNTLIALAACHEKEGKTATAWGEFLEAAEQASALIASVAADPPASRGPIDKRGGASGV